MKDENDNEHMYFHSSNLEHFKHLREIYGFGHPPYNNHVMQANLLPNELGCIKLGTVYIHFVLGLVRNRNCQWCDHELEFMKKLSDDSLGLFAYDCFLRCKKCKSNGPITILTVNSESMWDVIERLIREKYSQTVPWDKKLIG